jgi:hypothetical protein
MLCNGTDYAQAGHTARPRRGGQVIFRLCGRAAEYRSIEERMVTPPFDTRADHLQAETVRKFLAGPAEIRDLTPGI